VASASVVQEQAAQSSGQRHSMSDQQIPEILKPVIDSGSRHLVRESFEQTVLRSYAGIHKSWRPLKLEGCPKRARNGRSVVRE
jgi:hypothetical protein